jgi:hypothetical protein
MSCSSYTRSKNPSLAVHLTILLRSRSATVSKPYQPRRMSIQLPFATTQLSLQHFGCEIFLISLTCLGTWTKRSAYLNPDSHNFRG